MEDRIVSWSKCWIFEETGHRISEKTILNQFLRRSLRNLRLCLPVRCFITTFIYILSHPVTTQFFPYFSAVCSAKYSIIPFLNLIICNISYNFLDVKYQEVSRTPKRCSWILTVRRIIRLRIVRLKKLIRYAFL